jgi:peptide/nickel transport system permease protein
MTTITIPPAAPALADPVTHPPGDPRSTVETIIEPPFAAVRRVAWLVAKKLLGAVFVLWAAITATFIAIHLAPGDTVALLLGENRWDEELRAQTIARWGLDQPVWSQYITYLARIPKGDLGVSYNLREEVAILITDNFPFTLQLTLTSITLAVVVAAAFALVATARNRGLRTTLRGFELVILSFPPYWLALVLLAVVSFRWGWFSIIDHRSAEALVLPTFAMGVPMGFFLSQVLGDGIDRALEQPFAASARARGASLASVRLRHAFRHAGLPTIQLVGLSIGSLLGGAVIVEQIFGRPGLGQLAVNAVIVKDVPLILGVTLVSTAAFVTMSTLVDIVGTVLDPRLRHGGRGELS